MKENWESLAKTLTEVPRVGLGKLKVASKEEQDEESTKVSRLPETSGEPRKRSTTTSRRKSRLPMKRTLLTY